MTGLAEALDLPFDEALAYLRQKASVPSRTWTDVWRKANVRSFTVAGAATRALAEDFRQEVLAAAARGETTQQFRARFDEVVKKHGWTHRGSPGWRARIIYETNMAMAYSAGRHAQMTDPAVLKSYPYWQYVHSGAKHPRLQHLAWNGLVLRADDPFWSWAYPPNGWGCGCRVRVVSEGGLKRMGRKGPDTAPERIRTQMISKKTGEVLRGSEGVDYGFDYNPGKVWQETPQALAPASATAGAPVAAPAPPVFSAPRPPLASKDIDDADKAMTSAYGDWADRLTDAERAALKDYKGTGYRQMNGYLRGDQTLDYLAKAVRDLDAALARAAAPRDMILVRGVGVADPVAALARGGKATVFRYDQFASFSLTEIKAGNFAQGSPAVFIEARVPKGYKGVAYVNRAPELLHREYEFIFRPGTRFRVVDRVKTSTEIRLVVEPITETGRRARIAPRRTGKAKRA